MDTVIEPGDGGAIQADHIEVAGTVRLIHDFTAAGEVRLLRRDRRGKRANR